MEDFFITEKTTNLNAPGIAMLVMGIVAVMLLPRRFMIVAFICMACFMTVGQRLVVASMSFNIMRLMIAAAWLRTLLRRETGLECLTVLDKTLLALVAVGAAIYVLRLKSLEGLVNQLGVAYDALGFFFLFRFSIRTYEDLLVAIKAMSVVMPLLMLLMSFEKLTGLNPFAVFGGVPEHSQVREGRLRAQGPFRHPILAGTVAATWIPLFAALWHEKGSSARLLSIVAVFSATVIVVLTSSSGPIMTYAFAVLSILLWRLRKSLRTLWYLLLLGLIVLAVVMKAPVWFVIARVGDVLGGGGYHRAFLIDQAIRHFGDWWLVGTSNTANWMVNTLAINPNMVDITNQFILEGVNGGMITLAVFVLLLWTAFRILVAAIPSDPLDSFEARVGWGLWGSLFSHVITFFSVAYFDQTNMFWYMLLACISLVQTKSLPAGRSLTKVHSLECPNAPPRALT